MPWGIVKIHASTIYKSYRGTSTIGRLTFFQIDNLQLAKPTRFLGVPRVWEKMKDKMEEAGSKASPIQKAVIKWAKTQATYRQHEILAGRMKHSDPGNLSYRLAHKLVLRYANRTNIHYISKIQNII